VDLSPEHEAFGVYQQVTLAPLDLLAPVVPSVFSAHSGALHRLGESTTPALG
jgi:hypothetical protein